MNGVVDYYRAQETLPTAGTVDLDELERWRRRLFAQLQTPVWALAGADVLEVGPDSGANSVVFSRWGCKLILAEPNEKARAALRRLGDWTLLPHSLAELPASMAGRFDLVDAEGFVQMLPVDEWLPQTARLLRPGGTLVVSYMTPEGSIVELLTKTVHRRYRQLGGQGGAWHLFGPKWQTVPHQRSFDAWTMDVLENPYVTGRHLLSTRDLAAAAGRHRLDLVATVPRWPRSGDPGRVACMLADLAAGDDPDMIAAYCRTDPLFLGTWGSPCWFSSLRRR